MLPKRFPEEGTQVVSAAARSAEESSGDASASTATLAIACSARLCTSRNPKQSLSLWPGPPRCRSLGRGRLRGAKTVQRRCSMGAVVFHGAALFLFILEDANAMDRGEALAEGDVVNGHQFFFPS